MITVLTGTNVFLLRRQLDKLVAEFIQQHGDLALERLDGEQAELEQLRDAVAGVPFLAAQKMVIVSGLGQNKPVAETIEHILDDVAETTNLIIYEPFPDKRTSYYKTLKKRGGFQEFSELDEQGLIRWLSLEAEQDGGSLTRSDAQYLIQRIGPEQMLLFSELQKLLLYDTNITRETIEKLTEQSPQSKIFDLLDAALAGNHTRALELYEDQRAQRVEPQYILAMITWQLQNLAYIMYAGGRSSQQIVLDAKLNPYVVRKAQTISSRLNIQRFKKYIEDALTIDIRAKTTPMNLDEALKNYILTM